MRGSPPDLFRTAAVWSPVSAPRCGSSRVGAAYRFEGPSPVVVSMPMRSPARRWIGLVAALALASFPLATLRCDSYARPQPAAASKAGGREWTASPAMASVVPGSLGAHAPQSIGSARGGGEVTLSSRPSVLEYGGRITIQAEWHDRAPPSAPGVLTDDRGVRYGTLSADPGGRSAELSLTWDRINDLSPLDFVGPEGQRRFVAVFTLEGGGEVVATTSVGLHCRGTSSCSGSCLDLQSSFLNCGKCRNACDDGQVCAAGQCSTHIEVDGRTDPRQPDCQTVCAMRGLACGG